MPRQLLRDGLLVADDWQYLTELESVAGATPAGGDLAAPGAAVAGLIVPFTRWKAERDRWAAHRGRLGVVLLPADKVEELAPDVLRLQLIAAEFPGPTDGRGYTQGRLLRERYHFKAELRAAGYVRRDQLFLLARCGFNSFQLAAHDLAGAATALSTFSAEYQPSNDAGLPRVLGHRSKPVSPPSRH
jgi:uncharacterized protein (DUF934 family)